MNRPHPSTLWKFIARAAFVAAFAALAVAIPYFGVDAGASGSNQVSAIQSERTKGDPEAIRAIQDFVERGVFDQLSSAKQMQLQLMSGLKYEEGTLKQGTPNGGVQPYLDLIGYDRITKLDTGDIFLAAIANQPVNDPVLDIIGSQKTQSETSVLFVSGTNLLATYNDSGSFGASGGGNVFTGYSTSTNNGMSWTDRTFIPVQGGIGHFGDPVLARNNATGVIFHATLSSTTNGMNIYRSTDNGVTWSAPANGAPGTAASAGDKEWIAVDNFAGTGNGTVYHVYRDFSGAPGMRFTKSTDGGLTFGPSPGFLASSTGQGAYVVVGADHSVYYFWLDSSGGQAIKVRKSTDQGATFAAAVPVSGVLNTTGTNGSLGLPAGYRSNAFPSCAAHPVNANNLYCTYNDIATGGGDRGEIFFQQSTDGGATWSARARVNSDSSTNAQAFPSMIMRPDGTALSIAWYDNRLDAANRKFARFATVGTISGNTVSFGPNFLIGDAVSTPVFGQDSVVNSVYMGDYDQGDATNTNFYSTHVDTRVGTQDVRSSVYTAAGPSGAILFATGNTLTGPLQVNSCTNFNVTIQNVGGDPSANTMVTVSSPTAGITFTNATQDYGTIAPGASATNPTPFQISVPAAFSCGSPITVNIAISSGDMSTLTVATQGPGQYTVTTQTGQTIVPGTTDVGNHIDDGVTSGVPIPFPFTFNGTAFNAINLASNGNAQFTSTNTAFTNVCPLPTTTMNNLLAVHWDDMRTDAQVNCSVFPNATCGIFTSTSGSAPNRIFNIEWRVVNFVATGETAGELNYEIRLYETSNIIEYVYGDVVGGTGHQNGGSASVGAQKGTGVNPGDTTLFSCNQANLSDGMLIRFTPAVGCPQGTGTCGGVAPVSIGGRVTAAVGGRPIARALVTITGPGTNLTAVTNIFGYYSFPTITANQTYTVSVGRKGFTFTPQMITPASSLTNVNFTGN